MTVFGLKRKWDDVLIDEEVRAKRLFPAVGFDDESGLFICADQTLGFVFDCYPLTGGGDAEYDHLQLLLNQEYPPGTSMQFCLYKSPDIRRSLTNYLMLRDHFDHPLLGEFIKDRVAFLSRHTEEPIVLKSQREGMVDIGMINNVRLIVSVKIPIENELPTEEDLTMAKTWRLKVESLLGAVPLPPVPVGPADYIRLMMTIMNWNPLSTWRNNPYIEYDEYQDINSQILDPMSSVMEVNPRLIRIGEEGEHPIYIKTMSAKTNPKSIFFGEGLGFVGDVMEGISTVHQNYMITANVLFDDAVKVKNALIHKRQMYVNQTQGPLRNFVSELNDKKADCDLIDKSMRDGGRPLFMSYTATVFGRTEKEAIQAAQTLQTQWSSMGFHLLDDEFIMLPVFANSLPLGCDRTAKNDLSYYKTLSSKEAPALIPVFAEWKGTGTPHVLLMSKTGQLMTLSLHDSTSNKNCVIAAESGSGKSFLLNEIILSYASEGAQIWVVDAGKSYAKLNSLLKGDFVQFDEQSQVCLNPFPLIDKYEEEEDGIVSIVCSMASESGTLDEFQVTGLKRIMKGCWDMYGKEMTVDRIAVACSEEENQRLRDLATRLFPFTTSGAYGRYFNGKNNINFSNPFTVLELDELQGRKHLRQVVLLQLIYQIQNEMYLGERDRKKLLIIDEAWALLKEGEISVFMEHAYRKFRKYGGSAIIATQSVSDLYENTVGRAIAENTATFLLLGQKAETIAQLKESKRLVLSPGGWHQLEKVKTKPGVYSEIFVDSQMGKGVGRLVVSPFQNLAYSTTPEDIHAIKVLQDKGLELADAIREVLRQRGQASY